MKKIIVLVVSALLVAVPVFATGVNDDKEIKENVVVEEPMAEIEDEDAVIDEVEEDEGEYIYTPEEMEEPDVDNMTEEECREWNYTHQDNFVLLECDPDLCPHEHATTCKYWEPAEGGHYEGIELDCPDCGCIFDNYNDSRTFIPDNQ